MNLIQGITGAWLQTIGLSVLLIGGGVLILSWLYDLGKYIDKQKQRQLKRNEIKRRKENIKRFMKEVA